MQVSPALGPEGLDVVADRRTGRAPNRDTSAVTFSCNQMGVYGEARARELTLALGRSVGA